MTGQELFAALSFVDERYIAEADTLSPQRNTPWMKVLSVAACLCILITGVYAFSRMQSKGAMESIKECETAAPAAAPESALEEAAPMEAPAATEAAPRQEPAAEKPEVEGGVSAAAGELQHVAFAHLRILNVLEDGSFEVYVERVSEEPGPFGAGVEMTLVIDPEMIPPTDRTDLEYSGEVAVDMLVEIQNGAYDAGTNILYAEGVFAAARE